MHWYQKDGTAFHTIEKADGSGIRNVDLRDARKYKLCPSVSNIIGLLNKPGLLIWKEKQVLDACTRHPFLDGDYKHWCQARSREARQEAEAAANIGKLVHANLESLFKGEAIQYNDYSRIALRAYDDILKELGEDTYVAEKSFAYKGYGGTCDLHSKRIVLDFKTKNKDEKEFKSVRAYKEHAMQLAAYKKGLDVPNAVCYNIFISTKVEGLYKWKKWEDKEIRDAYKMFMHLKRFWELSNGI